MGAQLGYINPNKYIVNIILEGEPNETQKKIDDKKKLISQKPKIIDNKLNENDR